MRGPAMMATANGHPHEHPPADLGAQHAPTASVALDIGAGHGALIIYPGERYRGAEIEISRVGGDGRRIHTGVHERATEAGSKLTAIFGSLAEGDWVVWGDAATARTTVSVSEGSVTELFLI
ncbi:MAG: phospholipase [Solirubrobacteraceae bacterium]